MASVSGSGLDPAWSRPKERDDGRALPISGMGEGGSGRLGWFLPKKEKGAGKKGAGR